ncbi:hypothetical protein F2Q68_00011942 [Brassica cretica]|uniref:Uncharacterized protein n=1 Tax=Brassica cretica TaxID=69181 RepID=A0A8S9KYG8_BRACR|nr:hypothetical protein F2Q68_00011942 [Brassica cretica]
MAANSSSVSVINHMPLSSLRSVSVPLSDRKLPTFRAFSSTAMADAGMDDVQRRLMFEDENIQTPTVTLEGDIFQPSDLLTGGSRKLEMLLSAGEESAMFVTFEAAMTKQTNVHAGMLQRLLTAWDKVSNPT